MSRNYPFGESYDPEVLYAREIYEIGGAVEQSDNGVDKGDGGTGSGGVSHQTPNSFFTCKVLGGYPYLICPCCGRARLSLVRVQRGIYLCRSCTKSIGRESVPTQTVCVRVSSSSFNDIRELIKRFREVPPGGG